MDANRFDSFSRAVGARTDRREMLKTAAAGTLALAGLGAVSRAALGQDVTAEASGGFQNDACSVNNDCRTGLICNTSRGKCEYKRNCGGKKGDACKNNGQCCSNKNLKCQNRKCKRDKRKN